MARAWGPLIPALLRLRQVYYCELQASQRYTVRFCILVPPVPKKKKTKSKANEREKLLKDFVRMAA